VSYRFAGAPDAETAAAIIACVEAAVGTGGAPETPRMPAWRRAGILDNVAPAPRAEPDAAWCQAASGR
jgi:hypothetical protein